MSDRIQDIRARVLCSRYEPDPSLEKLRQESLAQSAGEASVIREAKALSHIYRHQPVVIGEAELLAGTRPGLIVDADAPVKQNTFGRCAFSVPAASSWPLPLETEIFWKEGVLAGAGNHTTLDYVTIFKEGFSGLLRRVDSRLTTLTAAASMSQAKHDFLSALQIVGAGFLHLSERYADALETAATKSADCARQHELRVMARNCRRVPAHQPQTFWEACQCAWFAFFFLPDAPGRLDQYLYPCYRRELKRGTMTRDFAKELLSCLWLKYFEYVGAASGVSAHNHLTLGGVNEDGADACNEVTLLCLEVTEELRLQRPQIGLRWHKNMAPTLLTRAVRVLRSGSGNPDFCNDEQIIPALTRLGVRDEDARDFSLSGCHEVIITGKAQMGSVEGFINMPKILRMTLGLEPELQPDAQPGSIKAPAQLWKSLRVSLDRVAEMAHLSSLGRDSHAAKMPGGNLQASLVVQDCIRNCGGYTQGGARYNFCNWDIIGIANLADSLAVLEHFVFRKKLVSLAEFIEILETDWTGRENIRQQALTTVSHFGNDDPEVDDIAARIIVIFSEIFKKHVPFRGGEYILGTTAGGENMHVEFGRVTGATPDGRRGGEPLADSLGAAQGRDKHGVTALLNSVARLPHPLLPTATTLNVKLDPALIATDDGVAKIAAMIQSHFQSGGQQLQFNLVTRELLMQAKQEPHNHADLMVRVAGYCAPFTALWDDLQDEIVARTEHQSSPNLKAKSATPNSIP